MDTGSLGRGILFLALATALWATAAPIAGRTLRDRRFVTSGRRALYATAFLVLAATMLLVLALFQRDFSNEYVANYSSRSAPAVYTLTALWAGMEG